jgi:hypothetical protein
VGISLDTVANIEHRPVTIEDVGGIPEGDQGVVVDPTPLDDDSADESAQRQGRRNDEALTALVQRLDG